MNQGLTKWVGLAIIGCSSVAYAANEEADLPPLPEYYAQGVPPTFQERTSSTLGWAKGLYITPKIGIAWETINGIGNETPASEGSTNVPISQSSASDSVTQYGVGLGYRFREGGILSRIELEYMYHSSLDYNPDPLLNFTGLPEPTPDISLNSSITVQTIFGKLFYDINLGYPIVPYIQAGAGISIVQMSGNSTASFIGITQNGTTSDTNTALALEGGLGFRVKLNPHIFADLGYEFDYFSNDITWEVASFDPNVPITIKSDNFYSNAITLGLTFQA